MTAILKEDEHIDKYEMLKLENQLCFPLYACAKEVVRQYRKPLDSLNLTYTQYIVMMALWEHGDMTEKELGKLVHLDSGTLTALLRRLEKQGYIERARKETDERMLYLSLTDKGNKLRDKAVEVPSSIPNCLGLSHEELKDLKMILDKALDNMK